MIKFGMFLIFGLSTVALCAQDYTMPDSISAYQANVGFNSVTDGQPGPPKLPFYNILAGGQEGSDFQYQANIGYTFANKGFFRNTLFQAVVPTLDVGEGITDFEKSVSASWLQRWQYEQGKKPTISTMISLQVPFDEPGEKTDLVTTFIVTKNIKKGVGYFNAYAETTNGITTDSLEYGALLGYKFFLPKQKELFLDALLQLGKVVTFEASLEFDIPNSWSISPGINFAIDAVAKTTTFGGGVLFFYQSSKPLGAKRQKATTAN